MTPPRPPKKLAWSPGSHHAYPPQRKISRIWTPHITPQHLHHPACTLTQTPTCSIPQSCGRLPSPDSQMSGAFWDELPHSVTIRTVLPALPVG